MSVCGSRGGDASRVTMSATGGIRRLWFQAMGSCDPVRADERRRCHQPMNELISSHTTHDCGELLGKPGQFRENAGTAGVCGAGKNRKIRKIKAVGWGLALGRSVEVCPRRPEKNKGAGREPGTLAGTEWTISSSGFTTHTRTAQQFEDRTNRRLSSQRPAPPRIVPRNRPRRSGRNPLPIRRIW